MSEALAKSYARSKESFKKLSTPPTGKHLSLRNYMKTFPDYHPPEEENIKNTAVTIFKSKPLVSGKTNEVVWMKALSDTPIEYALQLARTYHGFAEGIRNREFFLNGRVYLWK